MSGLVWKLNRLRAMGAPEIAYRVKHAIQARLERFGLGLARPGEPRGTCGRPWLDELPHGFDAAIYRSAADRVLAGRYDVFALRDIELGFPPQWNRDPKTGRVAPLVFGKAIDYRDERLVGDIKYLWEPNRHAELVTLAQAWSLTREASYLKGCHALLTSWFEQCPYPLGVNWTSSLEHGVRLVNWAVAWFLLGEENLEAGLRQRWLDAIFKHCHFIAGYFSRHSSSNNHLLGELMGLFIGATVWPLWPESAQWRAQAAREFEAEALKQNAADGVNREQALWYHHEVADMMLLVGLFGRANGLEFSSKYWQRLERMLEFIAAVMDVEGHAPMFGDADDAQMVRWVPGRVGTEVGRESPPPPHPPLEMEGAGRSSQTFDVLRQEENTQTLGPMDAWGQVLRSLLATGAVLFGRGDFKAKAGVFDDKSRWLLGDAAAAFFEVLPRGSTEPRRAFPEGGYWVLGQDFDSPREVLLVADAGPLGYLSIAAHGHADALSFTLSVAGRELLIDPGTYAYHTQKKWRDYFRGTSAHNTVRVDGVDQSVIGGNFLWTRHAQARCLAWEPGAKTERWVGEHDGYRRLPDPVTHRREIVVEKLAQRILVTDTLECRGQHLVELHWHFAEGCDVCLEGRYVVARHENVVLKLSMPNSNWRVELVRGREEPPLGWVSRRFDIKTPITVAVWQGECVGSVALASVLEWDVIEDGRSANTGPLANH